jgi:hypothetical protein
MLAEVVRERGSLTQETLRLMWGFIRKDAADPAVKAAAVAVVGRGTPQEQASRAWAWTRRNIAYRPDPPNAELVQDLEASLRTRGGDCDDLAVVAGTLLAAAGHQVVPVAVWWQDRPRFTHAVLMDKTARMVVDPVAPTFQPWPPEGFGRKVYAMMEAAP